MLKKLIFGGVFSLSLLGLSNCFCDPAPPYVDFSEIDIHSLETEVTVGDSLLLYLDPREPVYISERVIQALSFSKAYATSCPNPGEAGMKFPIENMAITSNHDFDSGHKAGENLNDLFLVRTYTDWVPLSDSIINSNILSFGFYEVQLLLVNSPSLNTNHTFSIELIKSNQEVIVGNSEEIIWK